MQKIKDRWVLGLIAGLAGTVVKGGLNVLSQRLGLAKTSYARVAGGLFSTKSVSRSTSGQLAGRFSDAIVGSALGIGTTYLLSATGKDYHRLKGVLMANMAWLGIYAALPTIGVGNRSVRDPVTAVTGIVEFTAFGLTTAEVISRLGDDELFPTEGRLQIPIMSEEEKEQEQVPYKEEPQHVQS